MWSSDNRRNTESWPLLDSKGGKGGTIVSEKSFKLRCKSTNGESWIQDNEPISIEKINNGGAWPWACFHWLSTYTLRRTYAKTGESGEERTGWTETDVPPGGREDIFKDDSEIACPIESQTIWKFVREFWLYKGGGYGRRRRRASRKRRKAAGIFDKGAREGYSQWRSETMGHHQTCKADRVFTFKLNYFPRFVYD